MGLNVARGLWPGFVHGGVHGAVGTIAVGGGRGEVVGIEAASNAGDSGGRVAPISTQDKHGCPLTDDEPIPAGIKGAGDALAAEDTQQSETHKHQGIYIGSNPAAERGVNDAQAYGSNGLDDGRA